MDGDHHLNVLFVCSRNQWRSPTAERVWRKTPGVSVRSAGLSKSARRRISVSDLRWADMILVMEDKHTRQLRAQFRDEVRHKPVHVLDIPDDYRYIDPELIEILQAKVAPLLADGITLTE
ncbi:MAG: phosphotyrosine protein phosphatase [Pseudomonadota bacterium]